MANLITDLEKKIEQGYDLVDGNGDFIKSANVKKTLFKSYSKEVTIGNIDPTQTDFNTYYNQEIGCLMEVSKIIDDLFFFDSEESDEVTDSLPLPDMEDLEETI